MKLRLGASSLLDTDTASLRFQATQHIEIINLRNRSPVPGSSQVSGIEIRMLPPLIKNNRTPKFWPFPGKAKLYVITIVISDAANQLLGQMDLSSFARIGDGEKLPVNKTIFYWEKPDKETPAPNQVHVMSSIIKSKGALREAGKILGSIRTDNEYQQLLRQLSVLGSDVASYNIVTGIAQQITALIGTYLGRIEDRPIGAAVHSFTRLHGDWDELGIKPFQVITDNVDFNFELVVRDEERYILQHRDVLLPASTQAAKGYRSEMLPL
jgi:hypothetical protein